MTRSWGHEVHRLPEATTDHADRFGQTCATGKCVGLPTHATRWNYITGRSGRVSYTTRLLFLSTVGTRSWVASPTFALRASNMTCAFSFAAFAIWRTET